MSATLTPHGRGLLLTAVFCPELYTPPSSLFMALTRNVPVDNDEPDLLDEPVDPDTGLPLGGYGRLDLGSLNIDNWAFTGFSEVYNWNPYVWPAATGEWGLMQGWAILDSDVIGEGFVIAVGEQPEPYQILSAGDRPPPIDVGGLAIGLYD